MPNLTFIPLSLLSDNAPDVERVTRQQSPIVFGREAVFVDAEDAPPACPRSAGRCGVTSSWRRWSRKAAYSNSPFQR